MAEDDRDTGVRYRRDGKTPKGVPKGKRGRQPNRRPDYEVQKIDEGLMEVVTTPVRIYYDAQDRNGRPAEIWFQNERLGTYAKLSPAIDMAIKKANELKVRGRW